MALFSWFNSSDQVDTALVVVAVIGSIIELAVAIAAVINVHKEIEESRKKKRYDDLVDKIIANPTYSTDTRREIIEADKTNADELSSRLDDLDAWEAGLKAKLRDEQASWQIQHEKDTKSIRDNYTKAIPLFDYTIKKLINMSEKMAEHKGDKIVSNYHGMPTILDPDQARVDVAAIKFQTNTVWNFEIYLIASGSQLVINGNGSGFSITSGGSEELDIPGVNSRHFGFSPSDFQRSFDGELQEMIANEDVKAFK